MKNTHLVRARRRVGLSFLYKCEKRKPLQWLEQRSWYLMLSFSNKSKGSSKGTGKELQKLKRRDLLELLVEQLHEGDRLELELSRRETNIVELTGLTDRLKDRLDGKDVQIEHLKEKLNDKDVLIDRLKKRLDEKDEILEHTFESVKTLTTADGAAFEKELYKLEGLAAMHYLRQFGHHEEPKVELKEEDEAVTEAEVEPEAVLGVEPQVAEEAEPEAEEEAEAIAEEAPVEEPAGESEASEDAFEPEAEPEEADESETEDNQQVEESEAEESEDSEAEAESDGEADR